MLIRPETPADEALIHQVNEQAFGRPEESNLIDALRANNHVALSLVALEEGQIAGHILFFPLTIEAGAETHAAVGLGPMAVAPPFQNRGIGSALVRAGLEELKKGGHRGVIVLGHPEFYPRFGFVPAATYGIGTRYDVPDEAFMALELQPNGLDGKFGTVIYSAEFDAV